jgi:hypothetical protein
MRAVCIRPPSHLIAEVVVQPLAIALLAGPFARELVDAGNTSIALGPLSGWGITRYWWTAIKLAITAALTLVVVGVLVPRLGAEADLAGTPHVFTMLEELPLAVAAALASSLPITNVGLAIYKPRWRLRKSTVLSPSVPRYA